MSTLGTISSGCFVCRDAVWFIKEENEIKALKLKTKRSKCLFSVTRGNINSLQGKIKFGVA